MRGGRGILPVLAAVVAGCAPTFAPPVRGAHATAPGRLDRGQLSVGGAAAGPIAPDAGGATFAYGIRDWVAIEAGASLRAAERAGWGIGWAGPRFTVRSSRAAPVRWIGDLELGLGVGAGGARAVRDAEGELVDDGRPWSKRPAGGGYAGLGGGLHVRWFSLFLRVRFDAAGADDVPPTLWTSGMLGFEFDVLRTAAITLGGGFVDHQNRAESVIVWFYQVGVTLFFDLRRP